jgi:starch synthase
MYIAMVASECAPVAKVGGLADVVHGLARELQLRGHAVEVVLPMYDCMRYDRIAGLEKCYEALWVPYFEHWIRCDVFRGHVDDFPCLFVKPLSRENFFDRGVYYGQDDDAARFAFFSRAALEYLFKTGRQPDVIHCHDWQTGLVPVLLYEMYQPMGMGHPRVCYTLHNVRHQGVTGPHILRQCGLEPAHLMVPDKLRDNTHAGAVNLMKGGIVYSNFVTTVSPRYAEEIKHTVLGHGLQGTLNANAHKFGGVLNGLDYATWNPEVDDHIPHRYSAGDIAGKFLDKQALRQRLMLQDRFKPIVAVVSRLDQQKGVQLISHAIFYALANRAQFVLLGAGSEKVINDHFLALKHRLNDNPDCHLEIAYDEELSHLFYAGADILVIPSAFEPCGLTQIIAMKYGTVPVVRATGGLADTVFDANHAHKPYEERTGFTFDDFSEAGLESALGRAIGLWYRFPRYFHQLRLNAMRQDYSWAQSGSHYLNIYEHIRA